MTSNGKKKKMQKKKNASMFIITYGLGHLYISAIGRWKNTKRMRYLPQSPRAT